MSLPDTSALTDHEREAINVAVSYSSVERLIASGTLCVCGVQLLVINGGLSLINEIAKEARAVFANLDAVVCWQVECSPATPDRKIAYSIRPVSNHADLSTLISRHGGY